MSARTFPPTPQPGCPNFLGLFIAVGPAATDMYLPAFPAVEATFGTAPGTAQLTLAAWFAGLAVGQITQGTLSDRFGRRIPLMAGFIIFTLSTIGCALAPSLTILAIFRAIAAFGASAGMVIARAMVRDLSRGPGRRHHDVPPGAWSWAWRPSSPPPRRRHPGLRALAGHLLAADPLRRRLRRRRWRVLPETLPEDRRTRLSFVGQAARYLMIVRERTFLTHAIMGGCGTFCMFAYLSGCSPVFEEGFGLSPSEFALIFGLCAVGLVACSQLNARLLPRVRPDPRADDDRSGVVLARPLCW